jgi:hypothetical protein
MHDKAVVVQSNTIVRIICRSGVSRWRLDSVRQQTVERVCARIIGSLHSRAGDASKGGGDMGSRVRMAAAACLVTSGLLAGGAGASMAFADPPVTGDEHTDDSWVMGQTTAVTVPVRSRSPIRTTKRAQLASVLSPAGQAANTPAM